MEGDPTPRPNFEFRRKKAFVSIQDRMELSCSSPRESSSGFSPSLTESLPLIQVRRRWCETEEKKKETWVDKKEGADELFPGAIEGVEIYREIMSYAPLTFSLSSLHVPGKCRAACSCSFLSVIARKKSRFADILMNSGGNNDEEFFK